MAGKLIIFSGPSGAGKSTIVKHLASIEKLNLAFSVSATSRKKRDTEVDGKDYYFLTIDEFKSKIDDNAFLEWEEVYSNHYYGTLKIEVDQLISSGKNVIFDIDVMGGLNIKRQFKDKTLSVFVNPPSLEELEKRLTERNTDTPENVNKRIRKARMEMNYARRFDHTILNDDLETAKAEAEKLVADFIEA